MKGRTCTVILAGKNTANRKWINHEIVESWNKGK
nr:TIR domain-containing protein [Ignatzschineria sp. F8392]